MTGLNATSVPQNFCLRSPKKVSGENLVCPAGKNKMVMEAVDSLDDFAKVVNQSAMVNISQLVGTANGEVIVQIYDWTSYFETMYKKIIGIKKYHYFSFDATSPGKVNVRCAHDGPVTTLNILKVDAELVNDDLPAVVPSKDLSMKGNGIYMIRYDSIVERNAKTLLVLSQSHQDQQVLHIN